MTGLGLQELDIKRDGDFLAHNNTTRFECRIPGESEIFAVDFGRCRKSDSSAAPWILRGSAQSFDVKYHLASDAMNGKVAFDGQFYTPFLRNRSGLEGQNGELFDVKEVGT